MTPEASETTLAAAQAHILNYALQQIAVINEATKADYLLKFANWKLSVDAGKIDNSNPPRPPKSFVLDYQPDESGTRWATWIQNGPPVCDLPPIPEDRSKPAPQSVSQGNEKVRNVPPGDHFPVGFQVADAEGNVWEKRASPTPFGTAFYYALIDPATFEPNGMKPQVAVWGT